MYTGNKLIELLEKQQETRYKTNLFRKGTFRIQWRAKVGSYPHPDGETMISAGEPCGNWETYKQQPRNDKFINKKGKEETIKKLEQYLNELPKLPINGYIPGSSIRGLVRAWVKKDPDKRSRMNELLGYQDDEKITPGKIEFLDAYPDKPTRLTIDIINPQQEFQVLHNQEKQSNPCPLYTLGDGDNKIKVTIAIRGIPNKATEEDVKQVWEWVEQALHFYGVGSRTASGYGMIKSENKPKPIRPKNEISKTFNFTLYSQGCYGANQKNRDDVQLRPSHWRGWLRSWVLRFLLGVMSRKNAEKILGDLLGNIDENSGKSYKGCVRLELVKNQLWGEVSEDEPDFYTWKGQLKITAPKDILSKIILPIIRFACSVGGVGRGWRRPLHIFSFNNGNKAARGCYLKLSHKVPDKNTGEKKIRLYQLSPNKPELWSKTYDQWLKAIKSYCGDKITIDTTINQNLEAEVFSPNTCAIYAVPGPDQNPIDESYQTWQNIRDNEETRGEGMTLIYQSKYKKKTEVGGDAGNGNASCSWVSIRRVNIPNKIAQTQCQEIVCLFMGGQLTKIDHTDNQNNLRSHFLKDLSNIPDSTLLFGVSPDNNN
ncbi:hypothetical protein cce_0357 [Crocosphaera subtropica ATCC 51142]|uniref:CRISPR type III-associated protein domain-containing protein n=1 Tax=Crocosphaera subtropica (strain ATCC 51142 / BH68) TaxID=43989 RepID=B1X167_CROS5|nr:RAMP superfamily CRISPR-associated protein [Crocosphaera subtropica]ACB49708.1 hypothetical protein cce_0357 [Crocosphaera subtropica ATCC 51142]